MSGRSLDELGDEAEIRRLVHRYADAASRRDPAGVAGVFTTDGEWRGEALGTHTGRPAVLAFFTDMLDGWSAFLQGLLSGVVELDDREPDRAIGRWFVQEIGQRDDGTSISVAGVYHDDYVREDGAWRIRTRRYDPLLVEVDDSVTALAFPADAPAVG